MNFLELASFQDFVSIPIEDKWTKCTVGLEHSVSGDYYWLTCTIMFYVEDQADLYLHGARGSRSDAELILSTLEANGFNQVLKRFMREWEYIDFQRDQNWGTFKKST
jgi:hypothetical protein